MRMHTFAPNEGGQSRAAAQALRQTCRAGGLYRRKDPRTARSAWRERGANPAGLAGLEGHDVESACRPGGLTESAQQVELRCPCDPLLLAPSNTCSGTPIARLAAGSDFNKHPFRAIAHDEVDLARLESHIAIDRTQALTTQELQCARLGIKPACLQRGWHDCGSAETDEMRTGAASRGQAIELSAMTLPPR